MYLSQISRQCSNPPYSSTGLYCDPQLLSWSNSSFGASQSCSDCWLGGLALKLSSPLGYDGDLGSNFASLTSLCSASQYSFATPTRYALNATDTGVPTPTSVAPPPVSLTLHIKSLIAVAFPSKIYTADYRYIQYNRVVLDHTPLTRRKTAPPCRRPSACPLITFFTTIAWTFTAKISMPLLAKRCVSRRRAPCTRGSHPTRATALSRSTRA